MTRYYDDDYTERDSESEATYYAMVNRIKTLTAQLQAEKDNSKKIVFESRLEVARLKVEIKKLNQQVAYFVAQRSKRNEIRKNNLDKHRDEYNAKRREEYAKTRGERVTNVCEWCGGDIPDTRKLDAKTCSEDCSKARRARSHREAVKRSRKKRC